MIQRILICLILTFGLGVGATAQAADFKVTRIVEIGPVSLSVDLGPLKFSPDGDKLGCFCGSTFMVSDTLGATRKVIQLDMRPMLFEWLSNDEILVLEYKSTGQASDYRRLSRLDINSGAMATLHEHSRSPGGETSGTLPIKGLVKTVEGHTGYALMKSRRERELVFPESKYDKTARGKALSEDHFLVWGDDGLYKVSTNMLDSVRIGPKFVRFDLIPPVYDKNLTYVMDGGTIMRLADSTFLVLDTLFDTPKGFIGCSAFWYDLNPVLPEVVFDWSCYRRDSTGADKYSDRLLLLMLESGQSISLDELIGMENCQAPAYAPDGRKIAFSANGKGYIAYREWNDREIKE